jgi:hypothetical protein
MEAAEFQAKVDAVLAQVLDKRGAGTTLHVTTNTVSTMARAREIHPIHINGRCTMFLREEVEEVAAQREAAKK